MRIKLLNTEDLQRGTICCGVQYHRTGSLSASECFHSVPPIRQKLPSDATSQGEAGSGYERWATAEQERKMSTQFPRSELLEEGVCISSSSDRLPASLSQPTVTSSKSKEEKTGRIDDRLTDAKKPPREETIHPSFLGQSARTFWRNVDSVNGRLDYKRLIPSLIQGF